MPENIYNVAFTTTYQNQNQHQSYYHRIVLDHILP